MVDNLVCAEFVNLTNFVQLALETALKTSFYFHPRASFNFNSLLINFALIRIQTLDCCEGAKKKNAMIPIGIISSLSPE